MDKAGIGKLITPVVAALSLEVDRLDVVGAGKRPLVRVFLDGDGVDGHGPSLDEIAEATRAVAAVLDDADITGGRPYTLEVSSRGVSRPLTEPKHFRRNAGRLVLLDRAAGQLSGRILDTDADAVTLATSNSTLTVPFSEITRAVVQLELNRPIDDETEPSEEEEA